MFLFLVRSLLPFFQLVAPLEPIEPVDPVDPVDPVEQGAQLIQSIQLIQLTGSTGSTGSTGHMNLLPRLPPHSINVQKKTLGHRRLLDAFGCLGMDCSDVVQNQLNFFFNS